MPSVGDKHETSSVSDEATVRSVGDAHGTSVVADETTVRSVGDTRETSSVADEATVSKSHGKAQSAPAVADQHKPEELIRKSPFEPTKAACKAAPKGKAKAKAKK